MYVVNQLFPPLRSSSAAILRKDVDMFHFSNIFFVFIFLKINIPSILELVGRQFKARKIKFFYLFLNNVLHRFIGEN